MYEIPSTEEALQREVQRLREEMAVQAQRLQAMTESRAILSSLLNTEVIKTAEAAGRAAALEVLLEASRARRILFVRYRNRSLGRLFGEGAITREEYFHLLDLEEELQDEG